MKAIIGALFAAAGILLSEPALAQAYVIDGFTFVVGGHQYRLCGIEAPELGEPGHRAAQIHLKEFTIGKPVRCRPVGTGTPCDGRSERMSYGRIVAQCFAEGEDIAAEMVRSGHAVDRPEFSGGYYAR